MSDINLLPEDLRSEEAKQLDQAPSAGPSVGFYFPQTNPESIKKETPVPMPQTDAIGPAPLKPVRNQFIGANYGSFNLDEEAKKGPLPETKSLNIFSNSLPKKNVQPTAAKAEGFLSRLFKKSQAKGRIIQNTEQKSANGLSSDKNVDVNLIPEGSDLLPSKKIYNFFIYYALAGILVNVLFFVGVVLYQRQVTVKQQQLTAKVSASEVRYNQLKAKEEALSNWYNKVQSIKVLFNNHIYWTNFFSRLESVTIPDIYYKDINTAIDGTVTLSAVSTSGYTGVAKQYLAYQRATDLITESSISNLAGDTASNDVNFTVNLKVDGEVYFLIPTASQQKNNQ
ncbi:MAG: hypothetical protein WCV73_01335 [Patescibacteria group bacterium]|jgi:hypothetical protein